MVSAPVLAASADTELVGIWARRPEAATELAARHATTAMRSVEELIEGSDAVAFAVPPAVQATLAGRAARAGRAVLLEKPIAADLAGAEALADAVREAGVASAVVLTWRYTATVRHFLAEARAVEAVGARGWFLSGSLLGGPFATPWRLAEGALLDLGPHVLDLLDAAVGEITSVRATGDPLRWVSVVCEHINGAVSEAALSASLTLDPHRGGVEVYGRDSMASVDCGSAVQPGDLASIPAYFADVVRSGRRHDLDVHRGLHLQRLLDAAARDLREH